MRVAVDLTSVESRLKIASGVPPALENLVPRWKVPPAQDEATESVVVVTINVLEQSPENRLALPPAR